MVEEAELFFVVFYFVLDGIEVVENPVEETYRHAAVVGPFDFHYKFAQVLAL